MFRQCLLILMALLLTTLPVLAEESPVLSEEVQLMQTANTALCERYALTVHCLGLFDTEIIRYGNAAFVRYIPRS